MNTKHIPLIYHQTSLLYSKSPELKTVISVQVYTLFLNETLDCRTTVRGVYFWLIEHTSSEHGTVMISPTLSITH